MVLLTMYQPAGRTVTQGYTTKASAEKEAAIVVVREWLKDHPGFYPGHCACDEEPTMHRRWDRLEFEQAFQREEYATCVQIWNIYCNNYRGGSSWLTISIKEIVVDQPFGGSSDKKESS